MNSTTKGIITVLIVGGIGYLAYKKFFQDKKAFYARKIAEAGKASNETVLKTFGEDYLKAWYKGIKSGADSFTYKNAQYNTDGGKLKK